MLPGTMVELLNASYNSAPAYLDDRLSGLQHRRTRVTSRVLSGEPASAIVAAARDFEADLLVLGTHVRAHRDAFGSGSVTTPLARKVHLPLLLVPLRNDPRSSPCAS